MIWLNSKRLKPNLSQIGIHKAIVCKVSADINVMHSITMVSKKLLIFSLSVISGRWQLFSTHVRIQNCPQHYSSFLKVMFSVGLQCSNIGRVEEGLQKVL